MWRPDDDLVAVGQRRPLDAAAVDVDAVERAVVEHAYAVGLGDDQRMTARDGRVVEAHVGGQRAADPRPLARRRARRCGGRSPRRRGTCRARQVRRGPRRSSRAGSARPARAAATGTAPSPATGRVPVASISPGVRGSMYVSPLARVARAVPATRPPSTDCRERVNGVGTPGRRGRLPRPRRRSTRTMPSDQPPPLRRRSAPSAPLESALLRRSVGRAEAAAPPLRALPPHAADRRAGPRLRGGGRRAPRVRAVPPAAPRAAGALGARCTRPSTSAPCACARRAA